MKLIKRLSAGALALAATASLASAAPVTIYIVASNGDRSPTQNAIGHLLAAGGNTWKYQGVGSVATGSSTSGSVGTPSNSNYGAWNGTFQGTPVTIKVTYAGALTGISAIAGNTVQRFVAVDGTGTTQPVDPTTATNQADYVTGVADIGFSTNFQSTSPFQGNYNGTFYNQIVEEKVGVSALVLVASPGFPATNITTQLAQQLFKVGSVPLAQFTGNPADKNKIVYALGRNADAGQRYGTYTEIGLGVNTVVNVYKPTIANQLTDQTTGFKYGGTASSHVLFPVATTPGGIDSGVPGNGGFTTANDLAPNLTVTALEPNAYKNNDPEFGFLYPNATAGYYIGYVTPNDFTTRIQPFGGVLLKYNGVDYSTANIQNGFYTPWIYNRILRRTGEGLTPFSGTTEEKTVKAAFYEALRNQILNVDATNGGGIKLDTLEVGRSTDGGLVYPLY